jgi:7,8-dihydropterin-6-yl-methyl-4-(beta-D-ribofuranosyl)aminobenzene 5'-phosphate synthase
MMKKERFGSIGRRGVTFVVSLLVFAGLAWAGPLTAGGGEVKITILYDNEPFVPGLKTDWGFSCLIQAGGRTILFDTGTDPAILLGNVKALGVDLSAVDTVFISHGHADHTGGLAEFLKLNGKVTVWLPDLGRAALTEAWSRQVESAGARVVRSEDPAEVCPGVRSTGILPRNVPEQALVIDTKDGAVVVTGCSHPGILDILRRAAEVSKRKIAFVLGGFHLLNMPEGDVRTIVRAFREELGVKAVSPTHCTGEKAISLFREAYGTDFVPVGAGKVLVLPLKAAERSGANKD